MKMRSLLLPLAILTLPVAHAQSAPDASAVLTNVDVRVAADASRLRYYLASSTDNALALLDGAQKQVFANALAGSDKLWSFAAAGSVQMSDIKGDEALIAWWNPVIDGGLAMRWRKAGTGWTLEAAAPFAGEELRGGQRATAWKAPAWAMADESSMGGALQTLLIETRAAAKAGGIAKVLAAPSPGEDITKRAAGAAASVNREAGDAQGAKMTAFVRELLAGEADIRKFGFVDLDARLMEIGTEARLMFMPQAAARRGNATTFYWVSAGAPDVAVLATFERQDDQPRLTKLSTVDLAGAFNRGNAQ